MDLMQDLKKRIVSLLTKWRNHTRRGFLWGFGGAVALALVGSIIYIISCVSNGRAIDRGLMIGLLSMTGIIGMMLGLIPYAVIKNRLYLECVETLKEYNIEIQKYCVESRLTKGGMKRVHYNPNSGIWPGEVVRSGLLQSVEENIKSDSYLEGVASGQKFRFSNIELTNRYVSSSSRAEKFFGGQFWTLSGERELPCRVIYFNNQLRDILAINYEVPWLFPDNSFRRIVPKDTILMENGTCLCDDKDSDEDVLSPDMEACVRSYMDTHGGEAFFIGFGNKEVFFFDFSENATEVVVKPRTVTLQSTFKVREFYEEMYLSYKESDKKGEEITKYLYEILEVFQEEGVMWNQIQADSQDELIDQLLAEVRRIGIR